MRTIHKECKPWRRQIKHVKGIVVWSEFKHQVLCLNCGIWLVILMHTFSGVLASQSRHVYTCVWLFLHLACSSRGAGAREIWQVLWYVVAGSHHVHPVSTCIFHSVRCQCLYPIAHTPHIMCECIHGNEWADRLASTADVTFDLQLGRAEAFWGGTF